MANLVISHSLIGRIEDSLFKFYAPKFIIIFMVWITFYGYVFSEAMIALKEHLLRSDFNPDHLLLRVLEVFKLKLKLL